MRWPLALAALLLAGCAAPVTTPDVAAPPGTVAYAPDCGLGTAGGAWTEPCVALASPNPSPSKAEIDIAVNPKDPSNVVVASKDRDKLGSSCVWAIPEVSKDGGRTWKSVYIGGKLAERKPGDALFGWGCVTDPIMVFDKNGVLYYTLQVDSFGRGYGPDAVFGEGQPFYGTEIVLARSKDGGLSWDKLVPFHAGDGTAVYQDYMRRAANPKTGSVYTVWNQISGVASVPVLVATRDGGETASAPVYVPSPEPGGSLGESGIVAAPDGAVYLLLGGPNSGNGVWLATSTDDARTFSTPVKVFTVAPIPGKLANSKFRAGTQVELAMDANGTLYAAWADYASQDADVLVSSSADKGRTWSAPVPVHAPSKADQWMPRVTVTSDGVVHVAYMTRAYDPANRLMDAEHAYSTDGGATWNATRLTRQSFDGDLGIHQDGFPFIGDYIGISSAGTVVYAGFPDCATGVCEIGVAKLSRA